MNLKELREKRAALLAQMQQLLELVAGEKRSKPTDTEQARYDALEKEADGLDAQIALVEKLEARKAKLMLETGTPLQGGDPGDEDQADSRFRRGRASDVKSAERKIAEDYSILTHVRSVLAGVPLSGAEKKAQEAAISEQRELNGSEITGAGVPSFLIGVQKRASPVGVTVGTASTNWVPTTVGELIPVLAPRLAAIEAGARVFSGLTADLKLPSMDQTVAVWETETGDADDAVGAVGGVLITPKRLAAYADVTKQMLIQSSPDIEKYLRDNLSRAVAIAVDKAALDSGPTGTGSGFGVLASLSGANLIACAGVRPTWEQIVAMEGIVDAAGAELDHLSYVMTPELRSALKTKNRGAGSGDGFIVDVANVANGYKVVTTGNMPKPSGTAHSAIFGNFDMLAIAQFGALDIIVDQYTKAKQGQIVLTVNSFWNTRVLQPKAFAGTLTAGLAG